MANMIETLFKTKPEKYGDSYDNHLLEMYKLYVEMTDRISQRRQTANTWFLTINTALLTVVGVFLSKGIDPAFFIFVALAGMINCSLWRRLILSYKQMNKGRFDVIHAIESKLPLCIYEAEWITLGEGKDKKKYKPFTHIEQLVPVVFLFLYCFMIVYFLFGKFNQ
ncbi:Small integral membrane protein [Candidatus Magnetomoraceae bacterium gMMP-15]